jgi:hypothetical protein
VSNIHYFGLPVRLWHVAAFLLMAVIAAAHAQSPEPALQATTTFENTVQDYVRMHRLLERQIGSIDFGTPVAEINRIIQELAAAIRAERHDATQGDFFTPRLAGVLRARINDALLEHGYTAGDVRAAARINGVDYDRVTLHVNGTFPWVLASGMFACVIEVLPPLPPELQYRIVGDDLVLIDVHASLIVDILPHVLVDMTAQQALPGGVR